MFSERTLDKPCQWILYVSGSLSRLDFYP
jgi:hypothetical protein